MSSGEQLTPVAEEAVRCAYTERSAQDYRLTYLSRDNLQPGETRSLHPVSIAARFAVDGSGLYTDFIDTDPDLAEVFPEYEIEACAQAGQYLLDNHMLLSLLEPDEVESFVASQSPARSSNNVRLKLIAGIQVMFDQVEEELVPMMIHHKGLEGITFYKREQLAGTLLREDMKSRSVSELMGASSVDDQNRLGLLYFPDGHTAQNLGEASARHLLRTEPIYY